MSNALSILESNNLPAHLQQFTTTLPQINLGGGTDTRNKITMKNGRFVLHISGSQEKVLQVLELPVIIVGAHDYVSRAYYATEYQAGMKQRPNCFSSDGITPAAAAPGKQAARCDLCPQNQKGSGKNGGKACSFFKRLVVLIAGKSTPFMLDVKGMSIFGNGNTAEGFYSLTEYSKVLAGKGINPSMVVTKLSFDPSATVSKIFFTPASFIDEAQAAQVAAILNDKETLDAYRAVEMDTIGDPPNEIAAAAAARQSNIAQPAQAPAQAAPKPAPAPAPAPATTAAPRVQKFNVRPQDTPIDVPQQAAPATPAAATVTQSAEVDALLEGIDFD